jgi:hypothetical protein
MIRFSIKRGETTYGPYKIYRLSVGRYTVGFSLGKSATFSYRKANSAGVFIRIGPFYFGRATSIAVLKGTTP